MKSLKIILVSILLTCVYSFTPDIFPFKTADKNNRIKCGFYINQRTSELFQVRSSSNLKCDSTFLFLSNSCLLDEKSSGTWSIKNDSVFLFPDKKTLRLIRQKRKRNFARLQYVDLSNNILIAEESFLIWQHSANYVDTLQESMTVKYDNN